MTAIDQLQPVESHQPVRATPSAPLRCAIVGAGKMGQHHARALRRLDARARVVAVADVMPQFGAAMHRIWPEAALFTSLEQLLDASDVDVVHICTSLESHERLASLALESGCHVYVEKPVAPTEAAAMRLTSLAAERGRVLCAGHQLLFEAPMRRMLQLLPCLGSLAHIESFFSFRPVRRGVGGRPALGAEQQLLDVLPHAVYPLLELLAQAEPGEAMELCAIEVGRGGAVHAIIRRGSTCGTLVVTLAGRPVESFLRVVGSNGTVHADFVRSTVQRLIGPGTSGVDKVLNPFRLAGQLAIGTTGALAARLAKRQRSYPGLEEIVAAFQDSILHGLPSPIAADSIVETVHVCEEVGRALRRCAPSVPVIRPSVQEPGALVTGGTGFLGRAVAESLAVGGTPVRVIGRRAPAPWECEPGVEYTTCDLADTLPPAIFDGIDVVIHCAAETAGGHEEHRRNSIAATEGVLRAAAGAGVRRFIHVSSIATLAPAGRDPLRDEDPLVSDAAERGPYIWGKAESERLAQLLGEELGIDVRIVRPGALLDFGRFDPPGKLGRRIGNIFVAVGAPSEPMGVADVHFAGRTIAWMAMHTDAAPRCLNLLAPTLPTRRELVTALRRSNPDLMVVWLPRAVLTVLSWLAVVLQKGLRPGRPAVNVAKVFAHQRYDTSRISNLDPALLSIAPSSRGIRKLQHVQ